MNLDDYLKGRCAADLAKAVGATQTEISHWRRGVRKCPPRRCLSIESATAGQVTRRDLRPNDWAEFWPELEEKAA